MHWLPANHGIGRPAKYGIGRPHTWRSSSAARSVPHSGTFRAAIDRRGNGGVIVNVLCEHSRIRNYLEDSRAMRIEDPQPPRAWLRLRGRPTEARNPKAGETRSSLRPWTAPYPAESKER